MTPADTDELAQRVNHLNAQRTTRAECAADFLCAVVVGILAGLALVHYAVPCAAGHLCMALAAIPLRPAQASALPLHPDARHQADLARAWAAGYDVAERAHHTAGWRLGVGHGLVAGVLLGAAGATAALHIGRLVG